MNKYLSLPICHSRVSGNPVFLTPFFLLFIILFSVNLYAQNKWIKTFGGTDDDAGYSVAQTTDNGYIITGFTKSYGAGGSDVYLIKTNSDGNCLEIKTFGGNKDDAGYSVEQTTDGGYIITGFTKSYGAGGMDVYLIKTDSLCDTLWTKTLGGNKDDAGYSVEQTTDGGYIITGFTKSYGAGGMDVYLIKTDNLGNALWTKTFGGIANDAGRSVLQTNDGGYAIAGWITYYGGNYEQVYLIKTDSLGDTLWTKTYGGSNNDAGYSVAQTTDGGYIITGWTTSYGGGREDVYLIKTNNTGDTLWTKTFGGTKDDEGQSVVQTTDGGYVIAGYRNAYFADDYDAWLIKTDGSGNKQWDKIFSTVYEHNDYGYSVRETSDNGYIIAGSVTNQYYPYYTDVWLIKTDSLGVSVKK
ncbi:MAG: hypothetical protein PHE49_04105 [bacterium]|nr:hypothetical protein [bacterium]